MAISFIIHISVAATVHYVLWKAPAMFMDCRVTRKTDALSDCEDAQADLNFAVRIWHNASSYSWLMQFSWQRALLTYEVGAAGPPA